MRGYETMSKTFVFTGSGGQGIMSMGTMLAQAAFESGRHAIYMPSYGAEQRGGSAKCIVIIDENEMPCPMFEYCETMVAMSNLGYNKFQYQLKPGGVLLYDNTVITQEIERDDVIKVPVPAGDLALEIGSPRVANVIADGVLVGMTGIVTPEEFIASLDKKFASKGQNVRDLNRKAFERGLKLAEQYK